MPSLTRKGVCKRSCVESADYCYLGEKCFARTVDALFKKASFIMISNGWYLLFIMKSMAGMLRMHSSNGSVFFAGAMNKL